MPVEPNVLRDLSHILDATRATGTLHDELALLRIAVRRYTEVGNAEEAVAWAATELSNVLTRQTRSNP